ncbi:hypothetical protein D9611_005396 [Ephemerocybe angulata]|uniref:Uncharacterized protein n=1 Tax=Ephemerocybe angulata TaxID=980116 RepID=A0A8H5C113_9AGAR|nr:hypothetical protein D9611_005396 [Tulosesus angulatus]
MPPSLPRKRTYASTSAYETDVENDYPFGRTRRQRTSSTTSVETLRTVHLPNTNQTSTGRVLITATAENAPQKIYVPVAATTTTNCKPESTLPSGIPRSVALRAKRSTHAKHGVKISANPPSATLSTTTKPSPAPPIATKLEGGTKVLDNGSSVSKTTTQPSSSKPSPPESTTKMASKAKIKPSSSKSSLDAILSEKPRPFPVVKLPPPSTRPSLTRTSSVSSLEPRQLPATQPLNPKRAKGDIATEPPSSNRVSAQTDQYGCVHLAPADCELFVSFSHSPHVEVWDRHDNSDIPCQVYLYIMAKNPSIWDGTPLSMPDVTLIDIECRTKSGPPRFSDRQSDFDHWQCRFDGSEIPSNPGRSEVPFVPSGTISIENVWDRVYSLPTVGKACDVNIVNRVAIPSQGLVTRNTIPSGLSNLLFSSSPSAEERSLQQSGLEAAKSVVPQISGRGWRLRFWVPVPAHLFLKKETRIFAVSAKVYMVPDGAGGGDIDYGFIASRTEMTVSHLRSEREMDGF